MFFASIHFLLLWNQSSDIIRVAGIDVLMTVWSLEVVVDQATLLLLSYSEVVTLKFRRKGLVTLLLLS